MRSLENWEKATLRSVSADISYGYTASASEKPVGPKFLRITDIQNDFVNWGTVPYCQISESNRKKYQLDVGDICVARTGATTGTTYTVKENVEAVFASYLIRYKIDKKVADPFYVGHLLRSEDWNDHVRSIIGGSAQPGANAKQFASFEFLLPSLGSQHTIAKILSDLDEKIELNHRMNKTLESIAHALFKRWFVDFEFPNEKGKPYKSSGGKMMDSEQGEIPIGWSLRSLYECADYINGSAFKNEDFSIKKQGLPIIKIGELKSGISDKTMFTEASLENKYRVESGDILFSWSGSPDTSIDTFIWAGGDGWLNQHIFKIQFKRKEDKYFVYFLLRYSKPVFIEIARNKQTTGLGHVTGQDLKRLKTGFPSEDVFRAFNQIAGPMFQKISSNFFEINVLINLRDSLLPKLMSGEIRVELHNVD